MFFVESLKIITFYYPIDMSIDACYCLNIVQVKLLCHLFQHIFAAFVSYEYSLFVVILLVFALEYQALFILLIMNYYTTLLPNKSHHILSQQ